MNTQTPQTRTIGTLTPASKSGQNEDWNDAMEIWNAATGTWDNPAQQDSQPRNVGALTPQNKS